MDENIENLINEVSELSYYVHQKEGFVDEYDVRYGTDIEHIKDQVMEYRLSREPEIEGFENIGLYAPRPTDLIFVYSGATSSANEMGHYERGQQVSHSVGFKKHIENQNQLCLF